jgi:hypothetical protein
MINKRIKIERYDDRPDWDELSITDGDELAYETPTWEFRVGEREHVVISRFSEEEGSRSLMLTQEELKQVVEFLQSKVK